MPCRLTGVYSASTRAVSICSQVLLVHFTPACILFDFSVLIYSIIAYFACIYAVFGLFLYVYAINIQFYTVLCGKIE